MAEDNEPEIEIIEKVKEEDFSDYCSNWEYGIGSQLPNKPLKRMIRRGNLSEVCGSYILAERKIKNDKWETIKETIETKD